MRYEVRALKGAEGIVALTFEATDEAAARQHARSQGLTVLSARPKQALPALGRLFQPKFPLLLFSQELLALLSAGLSLPEVIETVAEKESRPELRRLFGQLKDALYEGRSFSQARAERWGEPGALPDWVNRFTFEGDLRLRFQADRFADDNAFFLDPFQTNRNRALTLANTTEDRNRFRVRARFGLGVRG